MFHSAGKLHVQYGSDAIRNILFIPDGDHTFHHQGKTFAGFIQAAPQGREKLPRAAHVIAFEKTIPVTLSAPTNPEPDFLSTLRQAALCQCNVDIEVDFDPDPSRAAPSDLSGTGQLFVRLLSSLTAGESPNPVAPALVAVTISAVTHRK